MNFITRKYEYITIDDTARWISGVVQNESDYEWKIPPHPEMCIKRISWGYVKILSFNKKNVSVLSVLEKRWEKR